MAYRGGYYVKPVVSDYAGLASRYTEGKRAAEAVREQVRKERSEQLRALTESSNFEVTGIPTIDNAYRGTAANMKQELLAIHQANINGEMSRADARRVQSQFVGEANMMSNIVAFKKKGIEDIQKGIDKGDLSQATMDMYTADWIQENAQGVPNTYVDAEGNRRMAGRSMYPVISEGPDGRRTSGFAVRTSIVNKDGEVEEYEGFRSIGESVNTDRVNFREIDAIGYADELVGVTSKKKQLVVGNDGTMADNVILTEVNNLGQTSYRFNVNAPGALATVRNNLELNLEAMSDADIISILYSAQGRFISSPEVADRRTQEQIDATYNSGGNGALFDKNGDDLKIQGDPLIIGMDEFMQPELTEANREYAKALVRSNYYNGLNVTVDRISNKYSAGGSGNSKKELGDISLSYYQYVDESGVNQEIPMDAEFVNAMSQVEDLASSAAQGGPDSDDFATYNEAYNNLFVNGQTTISSGQASLNLIDADVYSLQGLSKKISLEGDKESVGRHPMETFDGIVIGKNQQGGNVIHLTGRAVVSDLQNVYKSAGGNKAADQSLAMGEEQVDYIQTVSEVLTDQEAKNVWKQMYFGLPQFRAWAIKSGYGVNPGKLAATAFREYADREETE